MESWLGSLIIFNIVYGWMLTMLLLLLCLIYPAFMPPKLYQRYLAVFSGDHKSFWRRMWGPHFVRVAHFMIASSFPEKVDFPFYPIGLQRRLAQRTPKWLRYPTIFILTNYFISFILVLLSLVHGFLILYF